MTDIILFRVPGFMPNKTKEYEIYTEKVYGFNNLMGMIIGNRTKEFLDFIYTSDAMEQAKETNSIGDTALIIALKINLDIKIIELLILISNVKHKNNKNDTALFSAVTSCNEYAIKLLLPYSDIMHQINGWTVIRSAIYYDAPEKIIDMLLQSEDKLIQFDILEMAVHKNNEYAVKLILSSPKISTIIKNKNGHDDTVLSIAVCKGYDTIAKMIYLIDPDIQRLILLHPVFVIKNLTFLYNNYK